MQQLLWLSIGASRKETSWQNKEMTWSDLCERLRKTVKTSESIKEYLAFSKDLQDERKDVGGFVGGVIVGGKRKKGSIQHRSLITLDVDFGPMEFFDDFELMFPDTACAVYSTHKHQPKSPRFRLVVPLSRDVLPDEYEAVARMLAGIIGIEMFDSTTFQAERLMYWPSTPRDVDYYWREQKGEFLDPDKMLARYSNWTDTTQWPISVKVGEYIKTSIVKLGDPTEKPGMIGAFCRSYGITDAIETFLHEEYTKAEGVDTRYTYRHGSTSGGVIIYDDVFCYSHHATDPAGGRTCNAFDLVRIHKFGQLDDGVSDRTNISKYPSHIRMEDFAKADSRVLKELAEIKMKKVRVHFGNTSVDGLEEQEAETEINVEWMSGLDADRKGNYLTNSKNILLILENDHMLRGRIRYDMLSQRTVVVKRLPWDRGETYPRAWSDDDWNCLRTLFGTAPYDLLRSPKLEDSMSTIRLNNRFHPIKEYISEHVWDGVERVDRLFIDYLGAENCEYVKAVTRKSLVAAIARVYNPGVKFDHVLTMVGKQGIGKSTIIKKLGGKWYSDTFNFNMLRGKEAFEQIQGKWLIEIPEMAGLKKADVEAAKTFISSNEDMYRPAYGRETVIAKRQCVFFGSTNSPDFLKKANGNRRFWPVDVGEFESVKDVFKDLTSQEVGQIWAEAAEMYGHGEDLMLSREMEEIAYKVQAGHEEVNALGHAIYDYLETLLPESWVDKSIRQRQIYFEYLSQDGTGVYGSDDIHELGVNTRNKVCVLEIWIEGMGKKKGDITMMHSKIINDFMREMPGWEASKGNLQFGKYGQQRGFVRIQARIQYLLNE